MPAAVDYPRRRRGGAATRLHETYTLRPRPRRDPVPTQYQRRGPTQYHRRGRAATRLHGILTSWPHWRRDQSPPNIHVVAAAAPPRLEEISTSRPRRAPRPVSAEYPRRTRATPYHYMLPGNRTIMDIVDDGRTRRALTRVKRAPRRGRGRRRPRTVVAGSALRGAARAVCCWPSAARRNSRPRTSPASARRAPGAAAAP